MKASESQWVPGSIVAPARPPRTFAPNQTRSVERLQTTLASTRMRGPRSEGCSSCQLPHSSTRVLEYTLSLPSDESSRPHLVCRARCEGFRPGFGVDANPPKQLLPLAPSLQPASPPRELPRRSDADDESVLRTPGDDLAVNGQVSFPPSEARCYLSYPSLNALSASCRIGVSRPGRCRFPSSHTSSACGCPTAFCKRMPEFQFSTTGGSRLGLPCGGPPGRRIPEVQPRFEETLLALIQTDELIADSCFLHAG